jgi:tape measure domain-containing protein
MAGAVSNLMVRAGFDGSQLTRGLQQMQGEVKGAHSSIASSLGTIGKVAGAAVLAAGSALAAMGGVIAKVGIQYDMAQENSRIAWTTLLGSADKAKTMLTDIANFAKNTQFDSEGVDAMAKYLTNAGYAGKELFDRLTEVADISGAFNIPADSAKELTRQMSQVVQAGVAYTEDLNILQDRGVPIYKAIAEQLGVDVGAVKMMASKGKLTSDIYVAAFDKIAKSVKGASEAQSKTMSGMISTLKDDFSIVAGVLAKPMFEKLHEGLSKLMPLMDGLTSFARGDLKSFSDVLNKTFGASTGNLVLNFVNTAKTGFGQLQSIIGKSKDAFKAFLDFAKGDNIQAINLLTKIGLSPEIVVGITKTVVGIKNAIYAFFQEYVGYVKGLFSGKNNLATSFMSIFNTIKSIVMPILSDIVKFIGSKFAEIKKWWDTYGGQITQAVKNFWAVIAAVFKFIAPVLLFVIKSVWENIKGVISGAIKIIQGIILVFTGIFTGNWKTMWKGIKDILSGAVQGIWNLIQLIFIGRVIKGIGGFFVTLKTMFSGGWEGIVAGIKGFVQGADGWFWTFLDGAKSKFLDIIKAAKEIPGGIVKGLTSGAKSIGNAIVGVADSLVKAFKKALGIKSPSKVFEGLGGHIISGLSNGLTSGNLLDLGKIVFKDFGGGIFNNFEKIKKYINMFDGGMLKNIGGNIKDFFTSVFSGGDSAGGSVTSWITQALGLTGAPASWLGPLSTLVQKESGGNPKAINLWDSNAKAGHPSKGLFQTIDSTFNAYAMKGLGGIYNPIANAVAGIRYIMSRYGSVFNVPGIKSMMGGGKYKGYAIGTGYSSEGWAMVGENGPELMNLPRGSQIKSNSITNSLLGNGLADVISGAVANAMLQVMQSNNNSNVNGDIVLNMDGRTFARIVKPWLDKENKRVGANVRLQSI